MDDADYITIVDESEAPDKTKRATRANLLKKAITMADESAPADPAAGNIKYYSKQIDANNNSLFVKKEIGGSIVEVEV